jgi:hypothetical protein
VDPPHHGETSIQDPDRPSLPRCAVTLQAVVLIQPRIADVPIQILERASRVLNGLVVGRLGQVSSRGFALLPTWPDAVVDGSDILPRRSNATETFIKRAVRLMWRVRSITASRQISLR